MNSTQKLEAIEKLMGYTGLEQGKARDFLEKGHWNVESAYRLYKTSRMEQQGFNKSNNRYSELVAGNRTRPGGVYIRPQLLDGFGLGNSVGMVAGMGPMIGGTVHPVHPAFQPPQPVPKFPVERSNERVIPIQIESRPSNPRLERQGAVQPHNAVPQATSKQPLQPIRTDNLHNQRGGFVQPNTVKGDKFPKSQSYPVTTKGGNFAHQQNPPNKPDNTTVITVGFEKKGDNFPKTVKGDNFPQVVKGDNSKPVTSVQEQEKTSPTAGPVVITSSGSSTPKVLKRGISKISENAMLVDEERKHVLQDITEDCHDHMYIQTFILPDVTGYAEDFRAFLEKDLIETSTLVSLEQAGRLNWWAELGVCQRLLPMATSGDGNCLLHAASLAMWGIHDRQLMLRKALYDTLTKKYYRQALQRRWRWQQEQANKQAGLIFCENEWQTEWENVLRLASTTPRALPGSTTIHRNSSCCDSMLTHPQMSSYNTEDLPVVYESLEEFHVFVLAHVIQRPIIVVADTILKDSSGDALAPIPFGGIYLPLEVEASHCYRSPLLLTYDAAHFSALVPMERSAELEKNNSVPVAIPTVSPELKSLPIHFCIDPGITFDWQNNNANFVMQEESKLNLLKRYLDLEKLPICGFYLDSNSDDKSSNGSYESDDGLIDRSKKKDNKVSQQLHTAKKQFGSFGKSVGKKLKNLGKGNKEDKKGMGRKLSMTQSTKLPLTIQALSELDQQAVWCSKIMLKKSDTHQKMIDNYLYDAGERFKKDMASRKLRNNEIVSRGLTTLVDTNTERRVPCVTSGCNLFGTVEMSYLCNKCYQDQKHSLLEQEKDLLKNFEDKHKHKSSDKMDVTKIGKSKFYDMNEKNSKGNSSPIPQPKLVVDLSSQPKGNNSQQNKDSNSRNSVPGKPHSRTRTPSPDYDNVDYSLAPIQPAVPQGMRVELIEKNGSHPPPMSPKPQPKGTSAMKCRNPTCDFYGSKDRDNYCSGCYKSLRKDLRNV